MSWEVQKYIGQAIVEHLNGNMELFKKWTGQAMELYQRNMHLYTEIGDMARIRRAGHEV